VSWTAKRTNDWVLHKAGVSRNLLELVKARKLMYFGHVEIKKSECGEADNAKNTSIWHKRQTETTRMDNTLQWTGVWIHIAQDTHVLIHGAAKPWNKDG